MSTSLARVTDGMGQRDLLRQALARTCQNLSTEVRDVPLEFWTESTFRYFLVKQLLAISPDTVCWSEWNRVDLVLPATSGAALVEIKFFVHQPLHHISGRIKRLKGRPSFKNLAEFKVALDRLANCRDKAWDRDCGGATTAFVVLAYLDPADPGPRATYDSFYGALDSNERISEVEVIVDKVPIDGRNQNSVLTCKLLSVRLLSASSSNVEPDQCSSADP